MRSLQEHEQGVGVIVSEGNRGWRVGAVADGERFLEGGVGPQHGFENGGGETEHFGGDAEDELESGRVGV